MTCLVGNFLAQTWIFGVSFEFGLEESGGPGQAHMPGLLAGIGKTMRASAMPRQPLYTLAAINSLLEKGRKSKYKQSRNAACNIKNKLHNQTSKLNQSLR